MEGPIPTAIGRYAIERLLGAGAMGNVFLARDPQLDRKVAIKTVKRLDLDPEQLETFLSRFRNEARAAARLHHPNIVQVYDVGEDPEFGPYLVMEYVAGAPLKQILRREGPLSPGAVALLTDEMAEALTAAHAQGIIHRDLKPDNLLMTPDGHVKLADFGVARIPDAALTREGQFLGTPCYAAPETLKAGVYGPLTDLFSMAAVIYESASGERAFPGGDAVAVAHKVLHDHPEAPSQTPQGGSIPVEVDEVVLRGLAKDPNERFTSPRELSFALRAAYEEAGALTPLPAPPLSRSTELSGAYGPASTELREPSSVAFYAVMLSALAIGVGLILAFRGDTRAATADESLAHADDQAEIVTTAEPERAPEELRPLTPDAGRPVTAAALPVEEPEELVVETGPALETLTPHEREELAKNALARARRAIRDGDTDAARAAIFEARRYDPGNADIARLLAQLEVMAPAPR
jgi:serine/threonine protein kinase